MGFKVYSCRQTVNELRLGCAAVITTDTSHYFAKVDFDIINYAENIYFGIVNCLVISVIFNDTWNFALTSITSLHTAICMSLIFVINYTITKDKKEPHQTNSHYKHQTKINDLEDTGTGVMCLSNVSWSNAYE